MAVAAIRNVRADQERNYAKTSAGLTKPPLASGEGKGGEAFPAERSEIPRGFSRFGIRGSNRQTLGKLGFWD